MARFAVLFVALAGFFGFCAAQGDPCMQYNSCQPCVEQTEYSCGWCSTRVFYKSGVWGGHCVSNNGSFPFSCEGTFSKLACQPGYLCNQTSNQCVETAPGEGVPYVQCLEQCAVVPPYPVNPPTAPVVPAKVYACNASTFQCFETVPGSGSSLAICQANCRHIPPSVPSAPTVPLATYSCNETSKTCYESPEGASKLLCETTCSSGAHYYSCDNATQQCVPNSSGSTLQVCELECGKFYHCNELTATCDLAPKGIPQQLCTEYCTNGNFTPIGLLGVWRGLQINTNFQMGEFQLLFNDTSLTMRTPQMGLVEGSLLFTTLGELRAANWSIARSNDSSWPAGSNVEFGFEYDSVSPELRYILLSASFNGGIPATWTQCVQSSSGFCSIMVACQPDTECVFNFNTLPNSLPPKHKLHSMLAQSVLVSDNEVGFTPSEDPCNPYKTCMECRAHPQCGWCTGTIVYAGGAVGGQCGGGGYANISFQCVNGTYHADDCNDYQCVEPAGVCDIVPLGHGVTRAQCEMSCTAGPVPPAPAPAPLPPPSPVYCCNHTTYQCFECAPGSPGAASHNICEGECKPIPPAVPSAPTMPLTTYICNTTLYMCVPIGPNGGTSLPVCQGQCPHPPPAPVPLVGNWRGLKVSNGYPSGEWDLNVYSNSSFSLFYNGDLETEGVIHADAASGSLVIVWSTGETRPAIYAQVDGAVGRWINLVIGNSPTDIPTGWDTPWILGGVSGSEFVFFHSNVTTSRPRGSGLDRF